MIPQRYVEIQLGPGTPDVRLTAEQARQLSGQLLIAAVNPRFSLKHLRNVRPDFGQDHEAGLEDSRVRWAVVV